MTDSFASVEAIRNGSHAEKDGTPSLTPDGSPESLFSKSVEDRLDALRETVRAWDWHQVSIPTRPGEPGADMGIASPEEQTPPSGPSQLESSLDHDLPSPATSAVLSPVVSPETPPAEPLGSPPPFAEPGGIPWNGTTSEPELTTGNLETVTSVTPPTRNGGAAAEDLTGFVPAIDVSTHDESPPSASAFAVPLVVPEPDSTSQREAERGASRSRTRTRTRIIVLAAVLVAVLAVGGIIEGIRLATKSSGGSDTSSSTQSTVAHHPATKQAPIDAAKLTRYEGYAAGLQKANEAATRGFVAAGSTPSSAQVAGIVTAYRSALNLYDFQLHFIAWPVSMSTAIATDHAQFQALMSFLQSFPSISPTGVSAWLTQLHNRTGSTAAADNVVRNDLGMSNSAAWP